jgi:hypothetical protein
LNETMTKIVLLETLRDRRAEFDAVLMKVPQEAMTLPGVQGEWSVKDIIAHLAYYERWMADRIHEQLRGETYTPNELDMMHFDARNIIIHGLYKDHTLPEVLALSQVAFHRLVSGVEAHSEAFLTEPQPILVGEMLRSEVYDHYRQHIPYIEAWLAARR